MVKKKKYSLGGILSSTASGAATGSAAGPIGTVVGAVGGLGAGVYGHLNEQTTLANQERLATQREEYDAQLLRGAPSVTDYSQAMSYAPTFSYGGSVKARKMPMGGSVQQELVELEKGEPFRTPDGTIGTVKNEDKLSHKNGGVTMPMEIGTEILGKNKDPETKQTFKELGRKLASQNAKYDKMLEENKNTYTQNAAKAMKSKTTKQWDALVDPKRNKSFRQPPQGQFAQGGKVKKYAWGGGVNYQSTPTLTMPEYQGFGSNLNLGGGYGDSSSLSFMSNMLGNTGAYGSSGSTGINMTQQPGIGSQWLQSQGGWGGVANSAMQLAPVAYNLLQGTDEPDYLEASDYYNPQYNKSIDLMQNRRWNSNTELKANKNATAIGRYNLQNQGASAGQQYSGFQALASNRMKQDASALRFGQNKNLGYIGEEAQMRAQLGANRASTNLAIEDINRQTKAAQQGMIAKGMEGISSYAQRNKLQTNMQDRDAQLIQILKNQYPEIWQNLAGNINFNG